MCKKLIVEYIILLFIHRVFPCRIPCQSFLYAPHVALNEDHNFISCWDYTFRKKKAHTYVVICILRNVIPITFYIEDYNMILLMCLTQTTCNLGELHYKYIYGGTYYVNIIKLLFDRFFLKILYLGMFWVLEIHEFYQCRTHLFSLCLQGQQTWHYWYRECINYYRHANKGIRALYWNSIAVIFLSIQVYPRWNKNEINTFWKFELPLISVRVLFALNVFRW